MCVIGIPSHVLKINIIVLENFHIYFAYDTYSLNYYYFGFYLLYIRNTVICVKHSHICLENSHIYMAKKSEIKSFDTVSKLYFIFPLEMN